MQRAKKVTSLVQIATPPPDSKLQDN